MNTQDGEAAREIVQRVMRQLDAVTAVETRDPEEGFPATFSDRPMVIGHLMVARQHLEEATACVSKAIAHHMGRFAPGGRGAP